VDYAIQICSYLIGIPLELLAIAALVRGGYRRFPLILVYVVALFLITVVELPTSLAYYADPTNRELIRRMIGGYYRNEGILQVAIFAVVISLIDAATVRLRPRRIVRLGLVAAAALFAGISFRVHYRPDVAIGLWMTPWTRDLKFCSAVLDVALWTLLIGSREKDQRLFILSGGLGIMFAGGSIGGSIRNLATPEQSHALAVIGGLIVNLSDFVWLYILWQTFRKDPPLNK
jgi:hypothetical protein